MKSCTGKILRVDLSAGTAVTEKIPDSVYENVLSGKGLAAWYLYKNIPPKPTIILPFLVFSRKLFSLFLNSSGRFRAGVITEILTGCETADTVLIVKMSRCAVDPAETKRFFHGIVIGKCRFSRFFRRKNKPDLVFGFEVFLKPFSPYFAVSGVKRFFLLHLCIFVSVSNSHFIVQHHLDETEI